MGVEGELELLGCCSDLGSSYEYYSDDPPSKLKKCGPARKYVKQYAKGLGDRPELQGLPRKPYFWIKFGKRTV